MDAPSPTTALRPAARRHPGFTLLELLVVVAIIALLIGILVPVLHSVRDASKKTVSVAVCNDVVNASSLFTQDARRAPGHFSAREMGAVGNLDSGFTNSENVLLDLAGGIVAEDINALPQGVPPPSSVPTDPGYSHVQVGPNSSPGTPSPTAPRVQVNNNLVGAGKGQGSYLQLKSDHLQIVEGERGDNPDGVADRGMVDIVDSFGMPVLIWTADETAGSQPEQFALNHSDLQSNAPADIAPYYWMSNGSYLGAFALGESKVRQSADPNNAANPGLSILGNDNEGNPNQRGKCTASLDAIIGSPSFSRPAASGNELVPLRARGTVVVVSAGPDKVYFARKQDPTRASTIMPLVDAVGYAPTRDGQAATPSNPADPTLNEASAFDDIIVAGGG